MTVHTILFTLYMILFINGSAQENYDWKCTDEFCQDVKCPQLPEDCAKNSKSLLVPSLDPCNCCDHCFLFLKEGEDCERITTELVLPRYICGRGLTCNELEKCGKMTTEDPHFFENYVCENDKCNCAVLLPKGKIRKIFGTFDKSSIAKNKKQCACSVLAYKAMTQTLRALPFKNVYQSSARCLENGQFDPLQCIGQVCGCVEADTGTPDENGFVYSLQALEENHPSCFNVSRHRRDYYTPCEKKRNQLITEINEEFWSGKKFIHFQKINCNPDGSYADS